MKHDLPYICPECGEPCEAIQCDDGLGPIEFWGAKSWDSRPYIGSSCCEAPLDGAEISDDSDRGDYEYDMRKDELEREKD